MPRQLLGLGLLSLLFSCANAPPPLPSGAPLFSDGRPEELALARSLAEPELARLAARHGVSGGFEVLRVRVDELATAHVRVRQTVDGIPVLGGEAILHLDAFGRVTGVTDDLLDDVEVDPEADLSADDALAQAVTTSGGWDILSADPVVDEVVLRRDDGDHLVYRVRLAQLDGARPSRPVVFVDAHAGDEVWRYDDLQTSGAATGSGSSTFYGTVSVGTWSSGSTWYLEDTVRHIGVYTFGHTTSSMSYYTDGDDRWTSSAEHEGVDAMYAAEAAYDYYDSTFGRAGVDGADGPGYVSSVTGTGAVLTLGVRYGSGYVNAYWDGDMIVAGSGDGTNSNALTTLDILGHELTHGVSDAEVGLTYSGESGALDESLSDVFGAMIERSVLGESGDTWEMGEATWTPSVSGDALRYLDDPTADGDSRDHYADRYTGSDDNGGVHTNSGIGNLAFYLLAKGGSHPRYGGVSVTAVGADTAAAIWYRAMTTYMTSSTTWSGARTATLSAAAELYGSGSTTYAAVQNAWADVGVGAAASSSSTCPSGSTASSGTLSATGSWSYKPSTSGYTSTSTGTQSITLLGPSTANFDLYLYRYSSSSSSWSSVASATGATSAESIAYSGAAGTWRVKVKSASGGGSFTVCIAHP